MCRGSVRANRTELAVAGVDYQIGQSFYGSGRSYRQGVLYASGNGYEPQVGDDQGKIVACAACVETKTRVMLSGIPQQLQDRLKVDQVVVADFVPGVDTARESQDQIRFDDGRQFTLWEFADQGVTLSLVMAEADAGSKSDRTQPASLPERAAAMA